MIRKLFFILAFSLFAITLGAFGQSASVAVQASNIQAHHRDGQTFITWQEIELAMPIDAPSGKEFWGIKNTQSSRVTYNVYRSAVPISSVSGMSPIAAVPSLSGWNANAYGIDSNISDRRVPRYVIKTGDSPLPNGTGLWVSTPTRGGKAYYAVTAIRDGVENKSLLAGNVLIDPVAETVGQGKPVLQRIESPEIFMGVKKPTLYYYTRWETTPNASVPGKAFDYLVGIPSKLANPAPVGFHLHCWGGSQESGYTWWNDAEDGAILLASNQDPYDWWTGYHEKLFNLSPKDSAVPWIAGKVRPYTTNRLFSFLYWMQREAPWKIDLYQTFAAGSSMGGSGSAMMGIRYGERIAWVRSNVGVHSPINTTTMKSAYAAVYGPADAGVLYENGIPVWNYYDDIWYLRQYPSKETAFISFSNSKNDPLIDWAQAVLFYRALQDTKRPHLFVWGQDGHNQAAKMPLNGSEQTMPIAIRVNQSLPAFTNCSLDDDPGDGNPIKGAVKGQINGYLYWDTSDIVDVPNRWEITVGLTTQAPLEDCRVDITPRRLQNFKTVSGYPVKWENRDLLTGMVLESGSVNADKSGLVTLPQLTITKGKNHIVIYK